MTASEEYEVKSISRKKQKYSQLSVFEKYNQLYSENISILEKRHGWEACLCQEKQSTMKWWQRLCISEGCAFSREKERRLQSCNQREMWLSERERNLWPILKCFSQLSVSSISQPPCPTASIKCETVMQSVMCVNEISTIDSYWAKYSMYIISL